MENRNYDYELDELIRDSMKLTDIPPKELDDALKAILYQQEAALQKTAPTRSVSLWYLPMILNFIAFALFGVIALLVIANPFIARFAAGLCGYMSIIGILITAIAVKRTNLKDELTVYIEKRGAVA